MITDYAGKPTYPYILTNEFGGAGSVTALKKLPPASKTSLYVGVSGFFNYDLIAVRKPSHVFLVDCNPYTIEVHRTLEAVILKTSDPKSCLTSLMQDIDQRPLSMLYYAEAGSSRAEIFKELSRPTSWLASQEAFAVIQGF